MKKNATSDKKNMIINDKRHKNMSILEFRCIPEWNKPNSSINIIAWFQFAEFGMFGMFKT